MSFTQTPALTIASRAATVYERAAAIARRRSPPDHAAGPDPAGVAAVRAWMQAFSPGDPDAFARRLAWDGLDVPTAIAAASPADDDVAGAGDWTDWLTRVLEGVPAVGRDPRDAVDREPLRREVPFAEIWEPFVRVGRAEVQSRTSPSAAAGCLPAALAAFERQLVRELSRQGEQALFDRFRAMSSTPGRYARFVADLLDGGLAGFLTEHAALARAASSVGADWAAATSELIHRLDVDRPAIARTFCGGGDPGRVALVEPGLSDPHHGRRRVARIEFESGLALIYKPRTIGIEQAFARLLRWFNEAFAPALPVLRVLDRGTYGWVDAASHEPMTSAADVEDYFRRSGALLCLAHVLRGRDLHMDNIVATRGGPVLIDLEMLLQPISRSVDRLMQDTPPHAATAWIDESCLATGLLSLVAITPAGEPYDSGGLRGERTGPLPFPRRVWTAVGTDGLHVVEEPSYAVPGAHRVLLGTRRCTPAEHVDALVGGFVDAYRSLRDRRVGLLAQGGPLRGFASCSTRVLPRPTNQYAMLSYVLAGPKFQRDGVARSTAVDVLHRAFAGSTSRPELWTMAVEERRAIDRLDIPYFSVPCDGTTAMCEDRLVAPDYFARSGLEAAQGRIDALSDEDLRIQAALLRRALAEGPTAHFSSMLPEGSGSTEAAEWIGRELLGRAIVEGESLRWPYRVSIEGPGWGDHHLYDGSIGPALFLAALSCTSPDPAWAPAARRALRPLQDFLAAGSLEQIPSSESIGATGGLGSVAYGLAVTGSLLGDPEILALAGHVAANITPRIAGDGALDVTDGAAGAALALAALFDLTGATSFVDGARACGDRLIDRQVAVGDGGAWRGADGRMLVGYAHGAAGIAHALSRVFALTRDERYRDASLRASRFVAQQFLPERANYALAASTEAAGGDRRTMTAWCHGAPGVLLGGASALDICEKAAILAGFDSALQTVARLDPGHADHLCCGVMGRVDVLQVLGQRSGRAEMGGAAGVLTHEVVARARARGHFRLSGPGVDYRVFDPGFFRGLSGIGYQLLRMAFPDRLPSILSFEGRARVSAPRAGSRP